MIKSVGSSENTGVRAEAKPDGAIVPSSVASGQRELRLR
jgi:hypothetical protein